MTGLLVLGGFVRESQAQTETYTYDAAGRLASVDYANGRRIQYAYDSLGQLVRRTVVAITDADNDGLDDGWEVLYFGDLARDGSNDFDGDGATDAEEFQAGTDPTSRVSLLQILRLSRADGASFVLEWASVPGKAYRIQYKETVDAPEWTDLGSEVVAEEDRTVRSDSVSAEVRQRFYRITISQ